MVGNPKALLDTRAIASYGDLMARMSPEDRREAIVSAALSVMLRQGIAATTVRDVAAEMGTSSGLIHHYYASMDELLAAAFERAAGDDLRATVEAMESGQDPLERLALFLASYARADEDFAIQLWLDAWAEAARRPALQRTSRRLNQTWQEQLVTVIGDGVHEGRMVCDDLDATAWRLLSLLDGLALQVVAHPDSISREQATRWSREGAENELGLAPGALERARVRSSAGEPAARP